MTVQSEYFATQHKPYQPLLTLACQHFHRGRHQGAYVLCVWPRIPSESPCLLLG